VTPSLYKIHRDHDTILEKVINNEKTEISAEALRELRLAAIGIQAHYGTPQDIEWAIDENDKLWILQARPITEFKPRTDVPELTDSDLKDGGISARVCTPLMYSAYQLALQPSMGGYFERIKLLSQGNAIQWMFYFYGRGYWNAEAVKMGLARLPDFNEEDFDKDPEGSKGKFLLKPPAVFGQLFEYQERIDEIEASALARLQADHNKRTNPEFLTGFPWNS
jgi:hypothetical protein